ncbi:MAG: hypothetical protein AAGI23_15785 [Bacteroidota bacterium]
MSYLLLDTATTSKYQLHARLIHLAYIQTDENGQIIHQQCNLIRPDGFQIDNADVHGISQDKAMQQGDTAADVLRPLLEKMNDTQLLIAHNIDYAMKVLFNEVRELGWNKSYFNLLYNKPTCCTMQSSIGFCNIRDPKRDRLKFPRLSELHHKLFQRDYELDENGHSKVYALNDCFFELKRLNIVN